MRSIDEVPDTEIRGKRVLVRAGLDLPLDMHGNVTDAFRVARSIATLQYLAARGARVIILSHIGRDPGETNEPVARALKEKLPSLVYINDLLGTAARGAVGAMRDGDILLLENLRSDPRETGNDDGFARELASLGEIYVDDAFSVAHRAHASIVGVPKYLPHYAGLLMRDEVRELERARAPESPSIAILGGAKFETKAPLIEKLLATHDHVFIGGALANDILKAQGFPVGRSLISKELPGAAVLENPRLVKPIDVTVENTDVQVSVKKPADVASGDKIVDTGPDSVGALAPYLAAAKSVLWNGPLGLYEDGYVHWSEATAELIAESPARKVIGGGDTIALIEGAHLDLEKLGFLSTGGGAMLDYLLQGTLPGIKALE